MKKTLVSLTAAAAAAFFASTASAVPVPAGALIETVGQTYNQSFDSLESTNGISFPAWSNHSTLPGWYLFRQPAPGTGITSYQAGTGSGTAGSFYSYGSASSTERALGGLGSGGTYFGSPSSGSVAGWIALALTNNTKTTLTSATIKFDGEQWRNGGNTSAQSMVLQYGFGGSFSDVATWTAPGGNFDWSSPVASSTAAAVNGNTAGCVANRGGTIPNLFWNPSDTLWIRWIEKNDTGNDHGLAIDNVEVTAIPEPSTYAAILGALAVGFAAWKRRRA